jgi:hypothetical protein
MQPQLIVVAEVEKLISKSVINLKRCAHLKPQKFN